MIFANDVQLLYPLENYLLNPAFNLDQRSGGGALASWANNAYGPDRWYNQQTTSAAFQRRLWFHGDVSVPVTCPGVGSYLQVKNNSASSHTIVLIQPITSLHSAELRGVNTPVTLTYAVQASSGTPTVKSRVLEWTSTADSASVKSPVSSFSAGVPSWVAINWNNLGEKSTTLVSGSWNYVTHNVTVTSGSGTNYAVALWTENQPTTVSLYWTLCVLSAGINPRPFKQRFNEQQLCEVYYEKSFDLTTAPADGVGANNYFGTAISTGLVQAPFTFKTRKRTTPTVTLYSGSSAGGTANWGYFTAGAWALPTSTAVTGSTQIQSIAQLSKTAGFTAANALMCNGHWTADSEM